MGNGILNKLADFILIAGMIMLGYGLWLVDEALAYSVIGGLLIVFGILIGRPERKTQSPAQQK